MSDQPRFILKLRSHLFLLKSTEAASEERERSEGPFQGKEGRVATGRAISRDNLIFGLPSGNLT